MGRMFYWTKKKKGNRYMTAVVRKNINREVMQESGVFRNEGKCVKCPSVHTEPKGNLEKIKKHKLEGLVVISALVTPLYGPCGTSLPVLHSAASKNGEGRPVGTNEAHAVGLNNSIDDDGVPDNDG